jgi:poly-beta-1,6-N-acetyl-D-glucosamine synthase
VGATGAIYALRRELFTPIPEDTILDDVWLPMAIVRRGYRVVFAPAARAFDRAPEEAGEEFRRKVRTIAGNFQLLRRERWLWSPRRNRLWLQTMSHKGLRLAGPVLLAAAFVANALLVSGRFYAALFTAQVFFYGAAVLGRFGHGGPRPSRLLVVPYVFCMMNWATVVALGRFIAGKQRVTWKA